MRTIYQAFDGKNFERADDCREYERSKVCTGIFAFDDNFNQMPLKDVIEQNGTYYVKITNPNAEKLLQEYLSDWDFTEAFVRGDINLNDKIWIWDSNEDVYTPFESYLKTQMERFDCLNNLSTDKRDE